MMATKTKTTTKASSAKTTTKKAASPKAAKPAAKAKGAAKGATNKTPVTGKLSQIAAAERVLAEANEPMTCQAMVEAMLANGYWSSPGGKTPEATLYASLLRQIRDKGAEATFVKVGRGLFGLASK